MLEIKGNKFELDGKPFEIYSGAIHYFRIRPEYWESSLAKLKAAGLNTVETYVCWDLHEPKKGTFDFGEGLDIAKFLATAQKLGLYAIVRPGPYICAEWDLGGLPPWLLKDRNIRLRCYDETCLGHVRDFYRALYGEIADRQITRGGNVIAMQVENEYGSYGNDKEYLAAIREIMRECGNEVLEFTADGNWCNMISAGMLDGVYETLTFGSGASGAFNALKGLQTGKPNMCMEFWDGWFDHWGEKHHVRPSFQVVNEVKDFVKGGSSFNLYMFQGGTNFGFMAGANHNKGYEPTTTSYDYNAPLTEWGEYTPLYHELRKVMLEKRGISPEELPLPPSPVYQTVGRVDLTDKASLKGNVKNIGKKHRCAYTASMEDLGQNYGYMIYHTEFQGKYHPRQLYFEDIHDRAYVYVNGKYVKTLWRNKKKKLFGSDGEPNMQSFLLTDCADGGSIDIFVEAMGRVNYGKEIYDRKGIGAVRFERQHMFGWDIYTLPMDDLDKLEYDGGGETPCFLRGKFKAGKGECFVHMDGFKKGFVTVNGFNIGRYWGIGPQKALYIPGSLLKEGEDNEIIVFEQEGYSSPSVVIDGTPDLG